MIEEGVRLTAIGMGTAAGLLLFLTLLIALVGRFLGSSSGESPAGLTSPPVESASDAHDKGLAAVVAVSAALGEADGAYTPDEADV